MTHRSDCALRASPHPPAPVMAVGVVVPAHDEVDRIERCLAALSTAVRFVRTQGPLTVRMLVVCDACTDGTEARTGAAPVLPVDLRNVGAARDRGLRQVLAELLAEGHELGSVWLATTDADSEVPAWWIAAQLDYAEVGYGAVVGTVAPRGDVPVPRAALRRVLDGYEHGSGHQHVHGANLGFRADAFLAAGGFPHLPAHEDVALVAALEAAGERVARTGCLSVATSQRMDGRAPEGFAATLRAAAG